MTQVCCPGCRLRFTGAAAAYLVACPQCGELLEPVPSSEGIVGFRRFSPDELIDVLPDAVTVALPSPSSDVDRA